MFLQQFYVEDLAHLSYLIAGDHACAVVDPQRDIRPYLDAAEEEGVEITHILETHLHADFVSGHLDLAKKTGAKIYAPKAGQCRFEHEPVAEGDVIRFDDIELRVVETPGHTPEGVCYVVRDLGRGEEPAGVFTGDTLLVGDVGRPDLFPGRSQELAAALFESLRKLLDLPDFCEIYPAHGAGSLCGKAIAGKRWSTIGYERRYNPALQHESADAFAAALLEGMPAAPDHFSRCSDINRRGPALLEELPEPQAMSAEEFKARVDAGAVILDARRYFLFAETHPAGAFNVSADIVFPTYAGWVLPPDRPVLLVVEEPSQVPALAAHLRRVGLDQVEGYLKDGVAGWVMADFEYGECDVISPQELKERLKSEREQVLDARTPREYAEGHIPGAVNIPAPDLRARADELDRSRPVVAVCQSGGRAGLAASLLLQRGFQDVAILSGGMTDWREAGGEVES